MNYDLSVIILSFNTSQITRRCLQKLKGAIDYSNKKFGIKVETIVLDNSSADDSVKMIRQDFPWVKLIVSKSNLGFSKGNNEAVKEAKGDLLLFLNSDVYVGKDSIEKSVDFFTQHQDCDAMGCRLSYENEKFQESAGFLPTPFNTTIWMLGLGSLPYFNSFIHLVHPKRPEFFAKVRKVEWVTGAFFMIKSKVFTEVGGFNEDIFMYMDEVELFQRLKVKSYITYYNPGFTVIHLGKASSNFNISSSLVNEVKGLLYFFGHYYKNSLGLIKASIFIGAGIRSVYALLSGNKQKYDAYREAVSLVLK